VDQADVRKDLVDHAAVRVEHQPQDEPRHHAGEQPGYEDEGSQQAAEREPLREEQRQQEADPELQHEGTAMKIAVWAITPGSVGLSRRPGSS